MGTDYETARALARGWWELDISERQKRRGHANCDAAAGHKVPVGEGCLCNPIKPLTKAPELVCEDCFNRLPYVPWDGGKRLSGGEAYLTIEEALAPLGKKVERPPVSVAPVLREMPTPSGRYWPRSLLLCMLMGIAGGALTAVSLAPTTTRTNAAVDGAILGLVCGLTAWGVGLRFRRADIVGRGLGTSPDRPEAAWRHTPSSAFIGGALGAGIVPLLTFLLANFPTLRPYFNRFSGHLTRLVADPVAVIGVAAALTAFIATLLPWGRSRFRGLGRGAGSVDGQARLGAILGAVTLGGLTGGLLTLRPELVRAGPGSAAHWVVYVAPVAGFLIGASPRNALVRGLAGALAGFAAVGAAAFFWRPEVRPEWASSFYEGKWWDLSRWSDLSLSVLCVGLPAVGALLGAMIPRAFLRGTVVVLASLLAGSWAVLAGAWLFPELTERAPGALKIILSEVTSSLGPRVILVGSITGLFAIGGATLGFLRGAMTGVLGLGLSYGIAYYGCDVVWPEFSRLGPNAVTDAAWRWSRWAGLPAAVLAPLAGYLLGRGRFEALAGGALGYAIGLILSLTTAEATRLDVAITLSQETGTRPLFWPMVVAASGVGGAIGTLSAVALTSLGRRWSKLKYVNKFACGWCGRLATRDARPSDRGPLLPVCGDPVCAKELGRLLDDPTALSLIAGPMSTVRFDEAPELPESVRDRATPGRMERLRRLADSYRPDEG